MGLFDKIKTQRAEAAAVATAPLMKAQEPATASEPEVLKPEPTPVAPKATAKPKAAPVQTATASVAKTEVRTVSAYNPFAIITGEGASDAESVLSALIARSEEKPSIMGPFPLVELKGGSNGGMLAAHDDLDADTAMQLPQGKYPFSAVFLGYRLTALAFPLSKEDADAAGGEKQPVFQGTVGCADAANIPLLQKACEAYQFTKKVEKSKFDNIGHVRMGLEILLFKLQQDGSPLVYVVRTPLNYSSATKSLAALGKALPNGQLRAFPVELTPISTDEKGATAWQCHSFLAKADITAKGKAVWDGFMGIREALLADEEFTATLTAWNQTDLSPAAIGALTQIAAMGRNR